MPNMKYRELSSGEAVDLQFYSYGILLEPGEIDLGPGSTLPDIETLHDPAYRLTFARKAALEAIKATAKDRIIDVSLTSLRSAFADAKTTLQAANDVAAIEAAKDAAITAINNLT